VVPQLCIAADAGSTYYPVIAIQDTSGNTAVDQFGNTGGAFYRRQIVLPLNFTAYCIQAPIPKVNAPPPFFSSQVQIPTQRKEARTFGAGLQSCSDKGQASDDDMVKHGSMMAVAGGTGG
jgi:hypothetical protein